VLHCHTLARASAVPPWGDATVSDRHWADGVVDATPAAAATPVAARPEAAPMWRNMERLFF
jgi:hypothetical protein